MPSDHGYDEWRKEYLRCLNVLLFAAGEDMLGKLEQIYGEDLYREGKGLNDGPPRLVGDKQARRELFEVMRQEISVDKPAGNYRAAATANSENVAP
jgi:hypothetical protein